MKKYVIEKYKYRLRNRNLRSMVIMVLFQMADDQWTKFCNDKFVQSVYSAGRRKEVSESFNRVRTDLKNQFRAQGLVNLYDEMMGVIADKADDLEPIADRFYNEIRTTLMQFMPYDELEAFSLAVASGTMLLLANDAYCVGAETGAQCNYFADTALSIDSLLSRVGLRRDVSGCMPDSVADNLIAAVIGEAEKGTEPSRAKSRMPDIVRMPEYRTATTTASFLDGIAASHGFKK